MPAHIAPKPYALVVASLSAVTAIVVLTSCGAPDTTTTQITYLNSKIIQLQKSLDNAASMQPTTQAKIESLNTKIVQLEKELADMKGAKPQDAPFVPGLGEIMGLNQMRHAKLWFASENANWPLAQYEYDELKEGFADIVHYHPTHDGVPRPLTEMIPQFTAVPMKSLGEAIVAKDKVQFNTAFDSLTTGCNSCHVAANFGFNVIVRPTASMYANQDFKPRP